MLAVTLSLVTLAPLALNTLLNAATFRPLPEAAPDFAGLVSICVPARNEAERLGPLLESFLTLSEGTPLELVVYDDDSTDGTAALVESYAARDKRIRLVRGTPLPAGWGGKVHALHRLSQEARGAWLVFVDADVVLHPGCVRRSLRAIARDRLDVLSLYPRQVLTTIAEQATVPCMVYYFHLLGSQWLLARGAKPKVVALNGQFMFWRREAYERIGGYASIRDAWLDDMIIASRAVAKGLRVRYRPAHDLVSCRMYDGFGSAWRGFAKHTWDSFSQPAPVYVILHAWLFVALVLPWLVALDGLVHPLSARDALLLALCGLLALMTRAISCAQAGGGWLTLFLHPVSMTLAIANGLYSYHLARKRSSAWKGRSRGDVALAEGK
ncbi:MAG TPA: glycosyltransferase [Oscillatoriaceae cyanobacterium]